MATNTSGGTTTSFTNTPQATADTYYETEDFLGITCFDVMSDDLGGNAKVLWSVDDGTNSTSSTLLGADLLVQDTAYVESLSTDTSKNGAKIWITSDGKVGYDASTLSSSFKSSLQALSVGETASDTFIYAIRLSNGTLSWTTVTVVYTGVNDGVIMAATQTAAVTEDSVLSAAGTASFTDADLHDTHTASFSADPSNQTHLGAFAIGQLVESNGSGSVTWSYQLNNAAAQYLGAGESVTEKYLITVDDGHGGKATQTVTVTITGTNDGPVAIGGGASGASVQEDVGVGADNKLHGSGSFQFTDVDHLDTHTVTVTPGSSAYVGALTAIVSHDSTNGATGQIDWSFSVDDAAVQYLGANEILTQTYTITVDDGHGGNVSQTVTITITGTNDNPVVASALSSTHAEGDAAYALDLLQGASDVDHGDVLSVTGVSYAVDGGSSSATAPAGVSLSGSTLTVDPTNAAFDHLAVGESMQIVVSYTVADNHGGTVAQTETITITGTNDAPTLSAGAQSVQLVEAGVDASNNPVAGTSTATIQLTKGDVDTGDTASYSTSGWTLVSGTTYSKAGTYGSVQLDTSTGLLTYTLDNSKSATNALAAGASASDSFSVTVSDGHGGLTTQNVSFAITGTNDAPTFTNGTWTWGTSNHSKDLTISGTLTDPDVGAGTDTVKIDWGDGTITQVQAGNGSFNQTHTYNNSGKFTFTITVTDQNGAVISQHTTTSSNGSGSFPAGVAGSPINLALQDPSGTGQLATVTIANMPTGWVLNGATHNADGTWTIQTSDIGSLTVTTPSDYSGAEIISVAATWLNADGSVSATTIVDNVEAYTAGSPIFAWSGDDTLTGSAAADLFVFSQPIGNDTVHSFDVSADKIDLIGYAGFGSFADVQNHMADDASGDAVITLGDGQSITLVGISSSSLTASNFEFDTTPTVTNSGTITVGNGAILPMSGTINNSGIINLAGNDQSTVLQLIQNGITLQGGGHVILSDSPANEITGTLPSVTFTNVDNVISGAGNLGGGSLTLVNGGTIDADGTNALVIDTGSNVVVNSGTLESTGLGGLQVVGALENDGLLLAQTGSITIGGDLTGTGHVEINGNALVEFAGAAANSIALDAGATGVIVFDHSDAFSGSITGLNSDDLLDLKDVQFGAGTTLTYSNGLLTVSDGTHSALLHVVGNYQEGNFSLTSDEHGGVLVHNDLLI